MNLPDWAEPVLEYMLEVGLKGTLQIAALSLAGSLLIGVTLGTLLTIKFLPSRAVIRFYIEVWRGLPILVTLFLVFFLLPVGRPAARVRRAHLRLDRADAVGQRAGRRGDARGRAVDPEGAARGSVCARLRLDRPARVRDPPAGAATAPASARRPARQHHPELDDRPGDRRAGAPGVRRATGGTTRRSTADRHRRDRGHPDLRHGHGDLLLHLVPAHAARRRTSRSG